MDYAVVYNTRAQEAEIEGKAPQASLRDYWSGGSERLLKIQDLTVCCEILSAKNVRS